MRTAILLGLTLVSSNAFAAPPAEKAPADKAPSATKAPSSTTSKKAKAGEACKSSSDCDQSAHSQACTSGKCEPGPTAPLPPT